MCPYGRGASVITTDVWHIGMERCFTSSATSSRRPPLFKMPLANALGGEQLKNPFPHFASPCSAHSSRTAFRHVYASIGHSLARSFFPWYAEGDLGGLEEGGGGNRVVSISLSPFTQGVCCRCGKVTPGHDLCLGPRHLETTWRQTQGGCSVWSYLSCSGNGMMETTS